jgi:hypothetical protein
MTAMSGPIPACLVEYGIRTYRVAVGALLALSVVVTSCLQGSSSAIAAGHDFQICQGQFALCAASTCKATRRFITVNVIGGGKARFPEYDCTCPILPGPSIADLNGGNMHGSCTPQQGQVWSLYAPRLQIPQAITGWVQKPPGNLAPPQICKADLNLGDKLVNCFSFACDPAGEINGVPVANCHCPLGESLEGKGVPPPTAFATQAGQGKTKICYDYPVAGPLPSVGEDSR